MSTYELQIDGSSAESGAQRIVKSFDAIKAAADRMEGGVSAAARKATLSFNSIKGPAIAQQAIDSIRNLSSAMTGFKGPSSAATKNTIEFLRGLKSIGSVSIGGAGKLGEILTPLANFKGPSAASAKNTAGLLRALGAFSGITGGRGATGVLNALASFKGPSSAGASNTKKLLDALANFTAPKGLGAVTQAFIALSNAANTASGAVGKLKSLTSGATTIKVNSSGASSAFRGLSQDSDLLRSSIFKTQTMLNSLGGILAIKKIVSLSGAVVQMKAQLEAATGSAAQARTEFGFLQRYANKLGLDFESLAGSFGFFLGAVKGTNVTFAESEKIFVGFTTAARALQLSTSDVDGVFRALGQMMSKGKLQAEELRGQLGDRLPGAFARFAAAANMSSAQLDQALKNGGISGDKLKDIILKVAESLQIEFAGAADKMSQTVSAAFNRLKNSFLAASSSLGTSGLNDAMIQLADTTRKFLESTALSKGLQVLGGLLKMVGDNINVFIYLVGTLALASTLKWFFALESVVKTFALLTAASKGFLALQMAVGLGNIASSATLASKAFAVLNAVVRANPFVFIAAAIVTLIVAMESLTATNEDHLKTLNAQTAGVATADNIMNFYSDAVNANSGVMDANIKKIREATIAQIILNRTKDLGELSFKKDWNFNLAKGGKSEYSVNGDVIGRNTDTILSSFTDKKTGKYIPAKDKAGFLKRANTLAQVGNLNKYDPNSMSGSSGIVDALKQDLNTADQASQFGGNDKLGYDAHGILTKRFPEAFPVGGTGKPTVPFTKPAKTKKDSSGNQDTSDLRRAMEQIRDLNREIDASNASVQQLLSDSSDAIAAQAEGAAKAIVNNIEDSYGSVERANKGFAAMAAELHLGVPYDQAKDAVTGYIQKLEEAKLHAAKDSDVAKEVNALQLENAQRLKNVDAIAAGGRAMEEANIRMEVEQKLVGTSVANRRELHDALQAEIQARNDLNRATETANVVREARSDASVQRDTSNLLGKGYSSDEINYYKSLYEERQKLINDGYYGQELTFRMELKRATLDLADATTKAFAEEEKLRQLAADEADAIVGAFKQGQEAGDSFLKTMKNIFNDLKSILLDFVLYNPLKKFLTDSLQGSSASGGRSAQAMRGAAQNVFGLSSSGVGDMGSFISNVGSSFTPNQLGSGTSSPKTAAQAANNPFVQGVGSSVADALAPSNDIMVTAFRGLEKRDQSYNIALNPPEKQNPFKELKGAFDWKANGTVFKNLATSLKGGPGATGVMSLGKTIGPAISKGFAALGTYMAVKGFAKSLGLGRVGSEVAGGAAAGFQVGGPLGAAIGAGLGLLKGLLTPKAKIPSTFGSVEVGSNGAAGVSSSGTYGKADASIGKAAAAAGSSLFNTFAVQFDGVLKAGKYGTFGQTRVGGKKGTDQSFYTSVGTDRKGRPQGVQGVDWITGTESQVQAFALVSQIKKGMIVVSDTINTIVRNTKSNTMEGLQADLAVGQAYDDFNKGSFRLTDLHKQMDTLDESFRKIAKQARALGLSELKLWAARDRVEKGLRKEFNFGVSQGILGITDPKQQAYNALVQEYKDTVENAMAVGGDILAVEKLYGLKRIELTKQNAEDMNNGIVKAAQDMLASLTSSSASPLNAGTVLANARDRYKGLQSELNGGNFSNAGDLQTVTQNYLDAAKEVNASSSGFFDIFNEVTSFLRSMTGVAPNGGGTSVVAVPDLPSLDSLVAEIKLNNQDIVDAQNNVGQAVTEIGQHTIDQLIRIGYTLEQIQTALGRPSTSVLPATGATGVGDTGGARDYSEYSRYSGYYNSKMNMY